jgi:flagellar motility protein MotE (MotC chaperone)
MKLLIISILLSFLIGLGAIMFFTGTFNQRSTQEPTPQPDSPVEGEIIAKTEDTQKKVEQQESDLQANEGDAELGRLQAELEEYRTQIAEAETKLNAIKAEIEALNTVKSSLTRSKQLAKMYSSMKPDSVALILCEMEVDLSMQILTQMNDRASAKVMNAIAELDPDYAAEIGKFMTDTHGT